MQSLIIDIGNIFGGLEKRLSVDVAAIAYSLLSVLTLFMSMVTLKLTQHLIATSQFLLLRGVFETILNYTTDVNAYDFQYGKQNWRVWNLILLRNIGANLKYLVMQILIYKLPLSEITVIDLSSIFMTGLADYIVNGQQYYIYEAVAALVTAFGVLLTVDPSIFGLPPKTESGESNGDYAYATGLEEIFYVCFYIVIQFIWAFSLVIVKKIPGVNVFAVNLPSGIILVFFTVITQAYFQDFKTVTVAACIFFFLWGGLLGFVSKALFVRSSQLGKPGRIMVIVSMNVVFAFIFEIAYLKQYPQMSSVLGSILIVGSTIYLSLKKDASKPK